MNLCLSWFFNLVLNAGDTALYSFFGVLMVPFLILTMADIILAGAVGILVVAVLFYLNTIPGFGVCVVCVMVAVFSLDHWAMCLEWTYHSSTWILRLTVSEFNIMKE